MKEQEAGEVNLMKSVSWQSFNIAKGHCNMSFKLKNDLSDEIANCKVSSTEQINIAKMRKKLHLIKLY